MYWRYVVAPQIIFLKEPLERPVTHPDLSMHVLFGQRDFLLALWSLASWYRVSSVRGQLYLHSDGTLIDTHRVTLAKLFPSAVFIDAKDVVAEHAEFFAAHPKLRDFRVEYTKFQAKKLLDPYLASLQEYRLVLDSDMIWFNDPVDIKERLDAGVPQALMMDDGGGTFSYVIFKDGTQLSDELAQFNSGVTLYRKEQFDLTKFEVYLDRIDWRTKKFTDQACYASIFWPAVTRLPPDRYLIKGTVTPSVVMRHYTNPQRAKFYFYGLNFIAADILNKHVRD